MLTPKQLKQRKQEEKYQRKIDAISAETSEPASQLTYPHVNNWIPVYGSDGYLDWNQTHGTIIISPQDEDAIYFDMFSLSDASLAYYIQPGDPLICRINELDEAEICLLNKAEVQSWEKNVDDRFWTGTIVIDGKVIKFEDTDLSHELKKESLKPGKIIIFDQDGKYIKYIRLAKPNVEELPEDRRKRILIKLGSISDGRTVTELCPEIETWECPYCKSYNLSKDKKGFHIVACGKEVCGAARPNPFYSKEKIVNNHITYTLGAITPLVWTEADVTEWINSNKNKEDKHNTVEQIIILANKDCNRAKLKECPGCEGKINQTGKGCCSIAIFDIHIRVQNFEEFYDLQADRKVGEVRRQQMKDLLDKFPPCCCNFLAIPKAPCNVFRNVKGGDLNKQGRKFFDNHYEKVKSEIMRQRVLNGKSILFPSISDSTQDQAMLCHIVPLQAAGCKSSLDNIKWRMEMCPLCQHLDELFTKWQGEL
jgi:hypothetical protein